MKKFFTSESVTVGHPDKICDQISDAILDALLAKDKMSRVACEVCATTGMVVIMGEVTTKATVNYSEIARKTIVDIGYDRSEYGFDGNTCAVLVTLDEQSPDIAQGVNNSLEYQSTNQIYDTIGAGDQGMMFGYATNETESLMPMALVLSHALTAKLTEVRKKGMLSYLRPDGKAQVTVEYNGHNIERIEAVVVSSQHNEDIDIADIRRDIKQYIIDAVIPANLIDDNTKFYINPTGRFVVGGPKGDSGLTGRKIIVDSYGGYSSHGGGCFSGKDPTKVDRSGTYYARYVAKNVVASGLAEKCEIQIAYAIGKANPVSIYIDTFGTAKYDETIIIRAVKEVFDFRPQAIIDQLDLRRPIYQKTACNGHFGKDGCSWEKTDKIEALKKAATQKI